MIGAVEASNGDFVVTGQVNAGTPLNPGATNTSWDIYVIRLSSSGGVLWEKLYARKNSGSSPDTHEAPEFIYKSVPEGNFVVTGHVIYSGVPGCPHSGYRASQALIIDGNGAVQNDFLMGGPSANGDGAVKTYYTTDGNHLVLTEQFYDTGLYNAGLQKHGATGALLWSRAYYETYQGNGEELLKITPGAVAETSDGYVIFGSTYYNVSPNPALGAYYHFKVDKSTGWTVAWNRKYRAWPDSDSVFILNSAITPSGGLVATISYGASTANDRIFNTLQSSGELQWVKEYGAHLGTVTPAYNSLAVTVNAFDAALAKLTTDGNTTATCAETTISDKTSEAAQHSILRTHVQDSYSASDCNSYIGRVSTYNVSLVEAGEYHEVSRCESSPDPVMPLEAILLLLFADN